MNKISIEKQNKVIKEVCEVLKNDIKEESADLELKKIQNKFELIEAVKKILKGFIEKEIEMTSIVCIVFAKSIIVFYGILRFKTFEYVSIQEAINKFCDGLKSFLIRKNKSYGGSFCNPQNLFCKSDPETQLRVRMDDKVKRILGGKEFEQEDTVYDLLGYLILLISLEKLKEGKEI